MTRMKETRNTINKENKSVHIGALITQAIPNPNEIIVTDWYGFIYITTNLVNGKRYIGQKKFDKGRWKNYLGSGKILKKAIEKYRKENFVRSIIYLASTSEELNQKEKEFIKFFNVTQGKEWYNISAGGIGCTFPDGHSKDVLEERNKKISLALKEFWSDPNNKKMMSESMSGKLSSMKGKKFTDDHKEKISKANKGRKHTNEHVEKLRVKQKERWSNPEERGKISEVNKGKTPWNKGKHTPEDVRKKQSDSAKKRFKSEEERDKIRRSRLGNPPSNKGKKMTDEQIAKLRESTKKRKYFNTCINCMKKFEARSSRTLKCEECKMR